MSKTKQAGSKDVAPMIRGAFKRACLILEKDGKSLSELIAEQLLEKPLDTLRAISSFVPKELEVTNTTKSIETMNDEELEQLASLAASIIDPDGNEAAGESASGSDIVH